MQVVPQWYIDAMKADSRNINCKIAISVDHKAATTPLHLDKEDIFDLECIQELQDAGVPCAYLGQNILTIKVYNKDGMFTKNKSSYEKYFKKGNYVRCDCTVSIPGQSMDFGPRLFTGYFDSLEVAEDTQSATITCYDSLHYIKSKKSPWFRPTGYYAEQRMSLKDMIDYYMKLCGFQPTSLEHGIHEDVVYMIDDGLTYEPDFLYVEGKTIGDVLTSFAKIGLCAIYCNAHGVLCFKLLPKTRNEVYKFDDETQVYSSSVSSLGYEEYTEVSVAVHDAIGTSKAYNIVHEAYRSEQKAMTVGTIDENNIELSSSRMPVAVRFLTDERQAEIADKNVGFCQLIRSYDYGYNIMSLCIDSKKALAADICIYSYEIWEQTTSQEVNVSPDYIDNSFFLTEKTLEIDEALITDKDYAKDISETFAKMLPAISQSLTAEVRGEPAIELLDLVSVYNEVAAQVNVQVLPTRLQYTYNGSLTCNIDAIYYSAVSMIIYAFLAPGMYIPFDMRAIYIAAKCSPEDAGIVNGAGAYALGDIITLTCEPFEGYKVAYWVDARGNRVSNSATAVITVERYEQYTAILSELEVSTSLTLDVPADALRVEIPVMSLQEVNGTVDWGDGTTEEYEANYPYEHTYATEGTYRITLQAPIVNMPDEIFRNNAMINSFIAGSKIAYLPAGMFANSSLKNINLLHAKNIVAVGEMQNNSWASTTGTGVWLGLPNQACDHSFNTTYSTDINSYSAGLGMVEPWTKNNVSVHSHYDGYPITYISTYNLSTFNGVYRLKDLSINAPLNTVRITSDFDNMQVGNRANFMLSNVSLNTYLQCVDIDWAESLTNISAPDTTYGTTVKLHSYVNNLATVHLGDQSTVLFNSAITHDLSIYFNANTAHVVVPSGIPNPTLIHVKPNTVITIRPNDVSNVFGIIRDL